MERFNLRDLLFLDKFIAPKLINIFYLFQVIFSIFIGILMIFNSDVRGLLFIFIAPVIIRVYSELLIIIFKIYKKLEIISNK